jgi:hypothetical protein
MLILRVAVVLTMLVIAGAVGAYLVTGQVRYRAFAWKTFKVLLAVLLVFLGLLALERVFVPFV